MGQNTTPAFLKPGDLVRIVPTARAITENELQAGIQLLLSWGLRVDLAENIGAKHNQFAGTDSERINAINAAIENNDVRAIWCARGGYGTVRTLSGINTAALQKDPKWFMGFSDITAIHNLMNNNGIASIHSQMPFAIDRKTPETKETLRCALFGKNYEIKTGTNTASKQGEVRGELVGGNLSVLYSLRGGDFDLSVDGKILFLEDLDELYYHLDRMVQNLKTGNWNEKIKGLIIGGMTDMWDKNPKDPFGLSMEQIILDAFGNKDIPIAFGFPSGHASDNQALLLGQKAKLSVSPSWTKLSFENLSA